MTRVTTHVLDTSTGRPGSGIRVDLERVSEPPEHVASGVTTYRLTFDSGAYFERTGVLGFFPSVSITFSTAASERHYHVPLLLAPFAYSTYRGS